MARILVVEDDSATRLKTTRLVRSLGHEVIQSSNGRRGLELLQDNPDIEILITDVMMPEMSGTELIDALRADSRFRDLAILIVSGYVGVRDVAKFLDSGATAFLRKPLGRSELAEYVERYCKAPVAADAVE